MRLPADLSLQLYYSLTIIMCKITPHTITQSTEYFQSALTRALKQVITDLKDPTHVHFNRFEICRPLLYQHYLKADASLNGIRLLLIEHTKITDQIKTAREELHDEWKLYDFQIVALQRPGTKPPFFIKEAA
jgi:hypothetical protein